MAPVIVFLDNFDHDDDDRDHDDHFHDDDDRDLDDHLHDDDDHYDQEREQTLLMSPRLRGSCHSLAFSSARSLSTDNLSFSSFEVKKKTLKCLKPKN